MPETRTGSPPLSIPGIEDLEPLGRGGFGTVYRGWQPELNRKVAVKVLDAPATDADSAARFRREGMAMGSLSDHPNVVPVYATGSVDDRLYLVMPLLPDGSLADQLRSGPLPADEVVRLGRGLADALAAAHGAGVLHRDVKPANVLLTPYGTLQLADFGIARLADTTQTMGGSLLATVAYAAPEVLSGQPASEASDVYSLGATLHAALSGRPPYEAAPDETPIAMAVRVLRADPPDLSDTGAPSALVAVVERAMSRAPEDRYPTAAALRDALDEVDLAAAPDPTATAAMAVTGAPTEVLPAQPDDHAVPVAVPAAPAEPPVHTRPAAAPPSEDRPGGRGLLVALALLVVLVGALALLASRDDGDDTTASPDVTEPEAPAGSDTTAAETTSPETTTPETTEATETTEAATEAPDPDPTTSSAEALRDYYALMDAGRIDEGWARLSPAYQERTGEASYRGFWETIAGVEVLSADGDDLDATATLRYTRDDGTTSTEDVVVRFVPDGSGGLLIDDYRTG